MLRHVREGGLLAIHDVFPDPAEGERPPYELYRRCLAPGSWHEWPPLAASGSCGDPTADAGPACGYPGVISFG